MTQKWEYRAIARMRLTGGKGVIYYGGNEYPSTKLVDILNMAGEEGWELVATTSEIDSDRSDDLAIVQTTSLNYILKRPKP
jgi:hypothetical protein